jgi:hypothetical protein
VEVSKPVELARIAEIKILQDVRLIHRLDLNPIYSKDNCRVQFVLAGEIRGDVICYLCLDGKELSAIERDYIYPLFVESMNILIGHQISLDDDLSHFKIKMSSPKLSMIPKELNTSLRSSTQKYNLELEANIFDVLIEYNLQAFN